MALVESRTSQNLIETLLAEGAVDINPLVRAEKVNGHIKISYTRESFTDIPIPCLEKRDGCYETLIPRQLIIFRIDELAKEIAQKYEGEEIQILPTTIDINRRHTVVVEDIIDTGHTLDQTWPQLQQGYKPAGLELFTLLSKPERRLFKVPTDYLGFEIPNVWVQGFGLDTDEKYRGIDDIVVNLYRLAESMKPAIA